MHACARCGEDNSDRARFCQACGTPLLSEGAVAKVRKTVTILFSDITGSTSLGERLDPESLRRLMGRYFDAMREVLEHHGGTVEKFIGDAIMAVFGIPRLHEDDALRAVRAAAGMRGRLAILNEELRDELGVEIATRTGIFTGEVVTGGPGGGQTLVTGDAVNTAARLEQAAGIGEILIGEPTYRLVRDAVLVEPIDPFDAKGKADPVPAYRLGEVIAGAETRVRRLDAPMVGREAEMRAILDAFDESAADGICRLVTVLGEAGIGKSRLVLEAVRAIGDRATVLRGRCLPYGEGITYWPVAEVVRQAAEISDQHPREEAQRRIAGTLGVTDRSDRIAEGVGELIGLGEAVRSVEEGFWAVRRFFEGLAMTGPLVLVFDDIHWGEETFLDLLSYVVEMTRGVPIFVLCLARMELLDRRPGWAAGPRSAVVVLESLGRNDCQALLRGLLGAAGVPAGVTTAIEGAAEGNPLFVEELLAMLIDDGLLVRDNGDWSPSPDLAHLAVPPTVQALLASRLEQLGGSERLVLEGASIVGEVFEWSAVAELVPSELRPDLGGHLMALVRREMVRPAPSDLSDEDAFRFRHLLIRDAAYEGMAKETRAELHERFARWLERAAPERLAEVQAIIGYHLERSSRYREELGGSIPPEVANEASHHLGEAGRRALARADMPAAANLLARALALLPAGDSRRALLSIDLIDSSRELGRFDRVEVLINEGKVSARAANDRGLELRFELRSINGRIMRDPTNVIMRDLMEASERIAAEAAALGEPLAEAEALLRAGRLKSDIGQASEAERTVARAKECFDRAGVQSAELAFVTGLTFSWQGPRRVADDIELAERTLRVADPSSPLAAFTLVGTAVSHAMAGDFDEARSLVRHGASILRDLGMSLELAASAGMSGAIVELLAGDLPAAEAAIRPAYGALLQMGEVGRVTSRAAVLAEVLYRQGRYDAALVLADEAASLSAPDDMEPQIWSRAVRAKALARAGRVQEAEADARAAVAMAEGTDWPGYQGTAWLDLAEVLRLMDRFAEAEEATRQSESRFEEKGSLVLTERARAFRRELDAAR